MELERGAADRSQSRGSSTGLEINAVGPDDEAAVGRDIETSRDTFVQKVGDNEVVAERRAVRLKESRLESRV